MSKGYKVFSPIAHSHPIAEGTELPLDWEFWRSFDESFIKHWATELWVLMLEGWDESVGVQAEICLAQALGLKIRYLEWDDGLITDLEKDI